MSEDGEPTVEPRSPETSRAQEPSGWATAAALTGLVFAFVGFLLPWAVLLYAQVVSKSAVLAARALHRTGSLSEGAFVGGFWFAFILLVVWLMVRAAMLLKPSLAKGRKSADDAEPKDDAPGEPEAEPRLGIIGEVPLSFAVVVAVLVLGKFEVKTDTIPDPFMAGALLFALAYVNLRILEWTARGLWAAGAWAARWSRRSAFGAGAIAAGGTVLGLCSVGLFAAMTLAVLHDQQFAQAPARTLSSPPSVLAMGLGADEDLVEEIRQAFKELAGDSDQPRRADRTSEECTEELHRPDPAGRSPLDSAFGAAKRSTRLDDADIADLVQDAILTICLENDPGRAHDLATYFVVAVDRRARTYQERYWGRLTSCEVEWVDERLQIEPAETRLRGEEKRLAEAWCALKVQEQTIVRTRLIAGLPFARVAKVAGITEKKARDRYRYAVRKLRRAYGL